MNRKGFLIGFLAGGWLATILVLLLPHVGLVPASAEEPGITIPLPPLPFGPGGPPGAGPSVNPSGGATGARGLVNPGGGTSDSNQRAIALSASIGSGQSAVYYFDTVAQRLCVYQYLTGGRGGLRLLAVRQIEHDLKLETYRDISEKSPSEMREAYEAAMRTGRQSRRGGAVMPTRRANLPGGLGGGGR